MKTINKYQIIFSVVYLGILPCTINSEPLEENHWYRLGVECQNVAYTQNRLNPNAGVSPARWLLDIAGIKIILGEMVRSEILVEKEFHLKSIEDMGDDYELLLEFAGKIGDERGIYVSLELLDLGFRHRMTPPGDPMDISNLTVRLPKEDEVPPKNWIDFNESFSGCLIQPEEPNET